MEKTFHGKSTAVGQGGRFAKMKSGLESKGYSAKSAGAISAKIGMEKYGKKRFEGMAAKGRARAAKG